MITKKLTDQVQGQNEKNWGKKSASNIIWHLTSTGQNFERQSAINENHHLENEEILYFLILKSRSPIKIEIHNLIWVQGC